MKSCPQLSTVNSQLSTVNSQLSTPLTPKKLSTCETSNHLSFVISILNHSVKVDFHVRVPLVVHLRLTDFDVVDSSLCGCYIHERVETISSTLRQFHVRVAFVLDLDGIFQRNHVVGENQRVPIVEETHWHFHA